MIFLTCHDTSSITPCELSTPRLLLTNSFLLNSRLTDQLMKLMRHAEKQDEETFCVAWMEDGKSFIIRNPDEFTREVVPKFFKATKFSSFTRKLYRWGFRQVNRGIGPDDPIIFGNEHFQRDNATLMAKMRSITAAGTRKQEQQLQKTSSPMFFPGMKHHLDDSMGLMGAFSTGFSVDESGHKRMMLEHIYQQQQKSNLLSQTCGVNASMNSNSNSNNNNGMFSGMSSNGSLSLTNALRPNMSSMNAAMNNFNTMNQNNMCPPQPTANSMIMQNIHSSNMGMGNGCSGNNAMNDMTSFDMLMQQHQNGGSMNAPFMNNNMGMNINSMNNNMGCNSINNNNNNNGMNSFGNLQNNFVSNLQQPQQQQFCGGMGGMGNSSGNGYHNAASTAEIVNAAIAALRYAS